MSNAKSKKYMKEWNGGTLEYWDEEKVCSLLSMIPSFQNDLYQILSFDI